MKVIANNSIGVQQPKEDREKQRLPYVLVRFSLLYLFEGSCNSSSFSGMFFSKVVLIWFDHRYLKKHVLAANW
jgi:hypothetical protein